MSICLDEDGSVRRGNASQHLTDPVCSLQSRQTRNNCSRGLQSNGRQIYSLLQQTQWHTRGCTIPPRGKRIPVLLGAQRQGKFLALLDDFSIDLHISQLDKDQLTSNPLVELCLEVKAASYNKSPRDVQDQLRNRTEHMGAQLSLHLPTTNSGHIRLGPPVRAIQKRYTNVSHNILW